jgi:hypothetical protein
MTYNVIKRNENGGSAAIQRYKGLGDEQSNYGKLQWIQFQNLASVT